ncbi:MAG: ethanolamine utilization protein EutH [Firmicutes bacterium]|nr:ethanolamine utilization protein EutH [Bacillota bacterium]
MYEELIRELSDTQVFWTSLDEIKQNFSANTVILWFMMIFSVIGGIDKVRGNKWGYGEKFDEAFATLKPMALAMIGVLTLVPVISLILEPLISPVYQLFGASPAMFAGTMFAVDAGAYPLAMELAGADTAIGSFSGIVLGSTFGGFILGMIPISLEILEEKDRKTFAAAVLVAIVTVPLGCIAGGLVMKAVGYDMTLGKLIVNLIPVIIVAALVALGLWLRPKTVMNGFCVLGRAMQAVLVFGIVVSSFQAVTGLRLPLFYLMVESSQPGGVSPLTDSLIIVGNIGLILTGAFPMILWISRTFQKPIQRLGKWLGMNEAAATGLLAALANYFPALNLVSQMNLKGKLLFLAFAMAASFVFGDHLGFTAGVDQGMVVPLVVAKLVAGVTALLLANAIAPKLIGNEE